MGKKYITISPKRFDVRLTNSRDSGKIVIPCNRTEMRSEMEMAVVVHMILQVRRFLQQSFLDKVLVLEL